MVHGFLGLPWFTLRVPQVMKLGNGTSSFHTMDFPMKTGDFMGFPSHDDRRVPQLDLMAPRHDSMPQAPYGLVPAGAIAQDRTWFTMIDYSITSTRWKLYILNEFNWCLYIDFSIRLDMYGHLSLALSLSLSLEIYECLFFVALHTIHCRR